jgi:preprotein translocase subunit YajC
MPAETVGGGSMLIMLLVMVAVMYFMIWRPESKRKKQAEEMRSSLKKGDQITTIGGIMGRIVHVTDETIVIETSDDRVRMELAKWSVSTNNTARSDDKKDKKAEKTEEPAQIEDGKE